MILLTNFGRNNLVELPRNDLKSISKVSKFLCEKRGNIQFSADGEKELQETNLGPTERQTTRYNFVSNLRGKRFRLQYKALREKNRLRGFIDKRL